MVDRMSKYTLTEEERRQLSDPEWVYRNLIIKGHILVLVAPPNGGKTTLMLSIASKICKMLDVTYVNSDVSGSDAKEMDLLAQKHGFRMLFPDLKIGLSMDSVVAELEQMNKEGGNYSNDVYIFDTLKKMTDVINKHQAKKLFKTLRGLSAKGMTIILLAHTNKHNSYDGKLIFEGTGDIRADADEMIYLEAQKHSDKSMTVSTVLEKTRGDFNPLTFEISPNRKVTATNHIDIALNKKTAAEKQKDQDVIDTIIQGLNGGSMIQKDLCDHCKGEGYSQGRVMKVLKKYSDGPGKLWIRSKGDKNSWNYSTL